MKERLSLLPRGRLRGAWLTGNVLALSVVSLLNDLSSEMIYALLPLFLTSVLGAGPAFLGWVEGLAESVASVWKLASGWLSDRVRRRKRLVVIGYVLSSVARPLVAAAQLPWHVLAVRVSDRMGKGTRTAPRDALLADSTSAERRGLAFSFHRGMDHLGAVLGPAAAFALLLLWPGELRRVFWVAAVPAGLALAVVWLAVRERRPASPAPEDPGEGGAQGGLGGFRSGLPRSFWSYLGAVLLFTLGNSTDAFLLLRAQSLGVSTAALPLLWGALHVSKVVCSMPGGHWSDLAGRKTAILSGWAVYAAVYVGFAFADSALHVWGLFVLYGLFYGLTEGPERALTVDFVPAEKRAFALGAYHLAVGIGALPASVAFGVVWEVWGPAAAFLMGAALALAASAWLVFAVRAPRAGLR